MTKAALKKIIESLELEKHSSIAWAAKYHLLMNLLNAGLLDDPYDLSLEEHGNGD